MSSRSIDVVASPDYWDSDKLNEWVRKNCFVNCRAIELSLPHDDLVEVTTRFMVSKEAYTELLKIISLKEKKDE